MNEDIFMHLVIILAVLFVIGLSLKKFFEKYSIPISPPKLSPSSTYSIKELLLFLINNKEARTRLFITLGILVVVRLCAFIPSPGINQEVLAQFFRRINANYQIFSETSPTRFSILSLGIMPFLSSCILVQILSVLVPYIRKTTFGGEKERAQIVKYTYGVTTALAILQSYFISLWLENPAHFFGQDILTIHGLPFRVITILTLTSAVLLLLFFASLIDKYGIGNGIAMIFISGSLMYIFSKIYQCYNLYLAGKIEMFGILVALAILVGALYLVFFFTSKEKRIELQEMATKKEFTIPLRVSWVGDVPIAFSESIYLFPATIAAIITNSAIQNIAYYLVENFWIRSLFIVVLIIIFTYFYAAIIFRPKNIQDLLLKYNYCLKSTENKEPTRYLDDNFSKLLVITVLLLIVVPNVPKIVGNLLQMKDFPMIIMHGSIILILAGVFFDVLSQLEFFYEKNKLSDKDLAIAYIAFDEIEAKIKSEYLKGKGIDALVEPLRFTWGMPIRTAVDQYRIYTASDKIKDARILIG